MPPTSKPEEPSKSTTTKLSTDIKLSHDIEVTSSSPNDRRTAIDWGYVTAYPHEYLIHFQNGKLNAKSSGQGARCLKWWNDTVFIIPTSLKEIVFQANQLSSDNVDVRLRGMAIYRIHDPLRIYTQLNFSNRQQAEEKLARMIGDLCRSTAKWLVANMPLSECLRKRKEEIAESLRREVAQVVSDPQKGWGVEIVTIDIQDIYIQDAEIFQAMQTLFKTEQLRTSQLSQLGLQKDLEVRKLEQELELAEHRKRKELENARIQAEIKAEQTRLAQENDKAQFALDQSRVEQNEAMAKYKLEQELERQRQKMLLHAQEQQDELNVKRATQQLEIETLERKVAAENSVTPLSLEKNFIESALPQLAEAMAHQMQNARFTVLQGGDAGGTPLRFILTEVLDILRERLAKVEKPG